MSDRRRYRILAPIARGSFGTVYRAELIGQGGFTKQVALKVLNPGLTENEEFTRRLRDEARLLALLRHRAIVAVDGLVELAGKWTVVMEYIEGADLKTLLQLGPLPPAAALEVTAEIASALHVAWTRKGPDGRPLRVLHRDLKPSNIRITPAGEVKVLDFGVARADFDSRESETRNLHFGSAAYMSPERIDFIDGPEGDVYAVGSMLFEMLAGGPLGKTTPDPGRHQARMSDAMTRLWETTQGQGAAVLGPLLSACLAYEANARPRARDLERRCVELARKAPGITLRDWAERAVGQSLPFADAAPKGSEDLSGSVIEETLDVPRADLPSVPRAPDPPTNLRGAVPNSPEPTPAPRDTPIRPLPELPDDEDSGDEDTDQGADSGWGARAHLTLPEISDAVPRQDGIPTPRLGDVPTQVRMAPPSGVHEVVQPASETVGLVPDDALFTDVLEEPSDRLEAIEFLTKTFEKPRDGRVPTDVKGVPRGRDVEPLRPHQPPTDSGDDGAGWVIGTLILAAVGFLVFTYMPEDPANRPSDDVPEARPADLPGRAWNPEQQDLRGLDPDDAPAGTPSPTPRAEPPPRGPGSAQTGQPTPAPAEQPLGSGTVRVSGFASRVTLIGGGRRLGPGEVPAGSYRVEAVFDDGPATKAGRIQVTDGSVQTLHCSKVYKTCRVE